jgi:peptide/nickel transport system substrate-binding protein
VRPERRPEVPRGSRVRKSQPQAPNEAWTRLEREVIDQALIVPLITPKVADFVSKRVGNYQRHPVYGMLISQVWVR